MHVIHGHYMLMCLLKLHGMFFIQIHLGESAIYKAVKISIRVHDFKQTISYIRMRKTHLVQPEEASLFLAYGHHLLIQWVLYLAVPLYLRNFILCKPFSKLKTIRR